MECIIIILILIVFNKGTIIIYSLFVDYMPLNDNKGTIIIHSLFVDYVPLNDNKGTIIIHSLFVDIAHRNVYK